MIPRVGILWQLATFVVTGCTLIAVSSAQTKLPNKGGELPRPVPLPQPIWTYKDCVERWMVEPSFKMWLMRIVIRKPTPPNVGARWDRGAGSLISRRHVLTSCFPVVRSEISGDLSIIDIFPAVVHYANVKPSEENGTFPWAKKEDSCFGGRYTVISTIAPRGCNIDYQNNPSKKPFSLNATADNYLILALAQEIPLKSANSQYMPFDFNIDRNMRTIRWFQSIRQARCVVPRFTPTPDATTDWPSQTIEQEGFTYRSTPFNQECLVKLCRRYCAHEENFNLEGGTEDRCNFACNHRFGRKFHGRLLCLQRMKENIAGVEKYSIALDVDGVQTPLKPKDAVTRETCGDRSVVHGAPVVCNGEVIAIVTQCFEHAHDEADAFLVATTLNHIHHQLLKWGPVY